MNLALEIFREKLDKEMTEFRKSYDDMERIRIYNDYYIIGFYEEYFEIFMSDFVEIHLSDNEIEWLAKMINPLAFFYDKWMSCDGAFSHNWDDMIDFVHEVYELIQE